MLSINKLKQLQNCISQLIKIAKQRNSKAKMINKLENHSKVQTYTHLNSKN